MFYDNQGGKILQAVTDDSMEIEMVSGLLWVQGGNNNTYCHDSALNWLDWRQAEAAGNGYARFFRHLVQFR